MIESQHTIVLILSKTPFYDLVRTIFEEIWFISEEEPYLCEKAMFVLT